MIRTLKKLFRLRELIVAIRNIRAEAKAPISMAVDIIVKIDRPELKNIFEDNLDYIERFTHPKSFIVSQSPAIPTLSMSQTITGATVHIPLSDLVDIDQEIERLNKETDHFQSEVKRSMKKLSSEKFIAKAPSQVVEKERAKLTDWQAKLDATKQRVEELKKNRD
ncbi:hypothetical protein Q757_08440 [Oenococcus alcoholitolerans]|uniref:valine--tRNA ligase n=1 Tax=Oenococcus alcoholitolerans TaxID=931074 RepID=A0ABR4XPH9_9LACO|nr:hypothetical protein Q757_08440 [Oenococcus alcoholitolerans]